MTTDPTRCPYGEMEWFCALAPGHDGPHRSDDLSPPPHQEGCVCHDCPGASQPSTGAERTAVDAPYREQCDGCIYGSDTLCQLAKGHGGSHYRDYGASVIFWGFGMVGSYGVRRGQSIDPDCPWCTYRGEGGPCDRHAEFLRSIGAEHLARGRT